MAEGLSVGLGVDERGADGKGVTIAGEAGCALTAGPAAPGGAASTRGSVPLRALPKSLVDGIDGEYVPPSGDCKRSSGGERLAIPLRELGEGALPSTAVVKLASDPPSSSLTAPPGSPDAGCPRQPALMAANRLYTSAARVHMYRIVVEEWR